MYKKVGGGGGKNIPPTSKVGGGEVPPLPPPPLTTPMKYFCKRMIKNDSISIIGLRSPILKSTVQSETSLNRPALGPKIMASLEGWPVL
jgi:hypothetical protein